MYNRSKSSFLPAITAAAAVIALPVAGLLAAAAPVRAQEAPASSVAPGAYKRVPALKFEKIPAVQVAAELSRVTGATVLVTGALATAPISVYIVGGSLEVILPQIVAKLPKGAEIRAAFVPAPDNGAAPTGDSVANYLRITALLKTPPPKIGATAPVLNASPMDASPGLMPVQWDVAGQMLPLDRALSLSAGLGFRPVYLLSLPLDKADPVALMAQMQADSMRQWLAMSSEQRTASAANQFAALMDMPSADRQAMLTQMMSQGAQMMQAIQTMPADQRQQFMSDIQAAMKSSGMIPPGRTAPPPGP